ncbi:MarR family winged helix-turn-helix transcriptional regulator [Micromonospora sp. IBHARD004]|uniref:MarR family winged helix-turn-helix transcriptional regulator n=1 Tax=Micromonospora sp. IBHARD004 TaxID=3457764 RepID=UPI0040598719
MLTTLTGQVIGQAHHATRAVLERELAGIGITFPQSVALNAVAAEGGVVERTALVGRMTGGLKVDESAVRTTLAELTDAGLLRTLPAGGSGLALTDAGRARQRQVADAVAGIVARLYADIPAAELEVAGRVLTLLKQRADAELAMA